MLTRNLRLFVVGMLVFVMASSAFAQGGKIAIGDTITESSTSVTEYTIELQADETIQISLESTEFDPYIELFDEDGDSIASDDDGGEGLNSLLIFTAPSSGTYTIRVRSFAGDSPGGEFTIAVDSSEVVGNASGGALVGGETTTFDPDGAITSTFTYDAAAGDVVTITVVSSGGEDSRLTVYNEDGDEIASNDDGGAGVNPRLTRLELVDGGTYSIEVTGFADAPLANEFDITVEPTTLLLLNDGPQTVELNEDEGTDRLALDVTDGSQWIITLSIDEATASTLYGTINSADELYSSTRFTFSGFTVASFFYTATTDGRVTLDLEFYGFDGDRTFEITAEPLNK